jgi:hypothetical protein
VASKHRRTEHWWQTISVFQQKVKQRTDILASNLYIHAVLPASQIPYSILFTQMEVDSKPKPLPPISNMPAD